MPDMFMAGPEKIVAQELSYLLAPNLSELPCNFWRKLLAHWIHHILDSHSSGWLSSSETYENPAVTDF
jgi:hypothetical protein